MKARVAYTRASKRSIAEERETPSEGPKVIEKGLDVVVLVTAEAVVDFDI